MLDPLLGYLILGARLAENPTQFSDGFNFGPSGFEPIPVMQLAEMFVHAWGRGEIESRPDASAPHEAKLPMSQ